MSWPALKTELWTKEHILQALYSVSHQHSLPLGVSLSPGDLGTHHGTALKSWMLKRWSRAESCHSCSSPVSPWWLSPGSSVILFVAGRTRSRNESWEGRTCCCLVSVLFVRADLFHISKLGTGKLVLIEHPTFLPASLLLRSMEDNEPSSW